MHGAARSNGHPLPRSAHMLGGRPGDEVIGQFLCRGSKPAPRRQEDPRNLGPRGQEERRGIDPAQPHRSISFYSVGEKSKRFK